MSRECQHVTSPPKSLCLEWHDRPAQGAYGALHAALQHAAGRYTFEATDHRSFTITYLDTVDRRLSRQGLILTHESNHAASVLVLAGPAEVHTTPLTEAP